MHGLRNGRLSRSELADAVKMLKVVYKSKKEVVSMIDLSGSDTGILYSPGDFMAKCKVCAPRIQQGSLSYSSL
jgi:hypothetical protein